MSPRHSRVPAVFGSLGFVALLLGASAVLTGAGLDFRPPSQPYGELSLRVIDAADGALLPARIRLQRVGAFEPPRVLIAGAAERRVGLLAGEYRIWASHGPEWSVAHGRVLLHAQERRELELSLSHEVQSGPYVPCDLHVHTGDSYDSQVSMSQRLVSAEAEGLRAAVITNHNRAVLEPALPESTRTLLVRGVEITTWDPEFGHFNWFPSSVAPIYKHSSPEQLLASLPRRPAGFIQVNHPRLQRHIGYFELAAERGVEQAMRPGFDGIEVWNGYDLHRTAERDRVLQDWLSLVAQGRRVVATGGSDSHDLERTLVGYPRTHVQVPESNRLDGTQLAAALATGRAFVSNGPIVQLEAEGRAPGETLLLAHGASHIPVDVRVDGPGWMDLQTLELWVNGARVVTEPIAAMLTRTKRPDRARAELHLELPAHGVHSVLAMVRGERPMAELFDRRAVRPFAFTNPVWVVRR